MEFLKSKFGFQKNDLGDYTFFSKFTFICLRITQWLSTVFGYYHTRPIRNEKLILFELETRSWKIWQIRLISFCKLFYGIFKILAFPVTYQVYGVSSIMALHFISLIQLSMSGVSEYMGRYRYIDEMLFIHKNIHKIIRKLKADQKEIKYWWESQGPQIIIINTVTHFWMTRVVYLVVFLFKRGAPLYLFRFLPDIVQTNYLAILTYGFFELIISGSWLDEIICTGAITMEYQVFVQSVLKVLRNDSEYSYEYKIKIFRRLQIMNRIFGQFFSPFFFAWQVIMVFFNIVAIYVTLYLFDSMHFLMWLLFPLSIVSASGFGNYMIGSFSKLDEQSIKGIQSLKQKFLHYEKDPKYRQNNLSRKAEIRSLKDLEMNFGQFGEMSPELMLFIMDQIVGNFLTLKDAMGK